MNCVDVCPKGLNPTLAIGKIKELLVQARGVMDRAARIERLKWQCRRGLLELDLVFERFWSGAGRRLDDEEAGGARARCSSCPTTTCWDLVMRPSERPGRAASGTWWHKLRAA